MNRIYTFLLLLFGIISTAKAQPQTIGGVYNSYSRALEFPTDCKIIVDSIMTLAPGDQILVIQMKGASILDADTSTYGDVVAYDGAGNYEIATINSINQDTILLEYQLKRIYDVNGIVQVIGGGQPTSVQVTSELRARPWDGSKGGIVFIDAPDSIILSANVNVKGLGFHGGEKSDASVNCNLMVYSIANSHQGGEKGESYVHYPQKKYGRGALASGGGGGNNHNSGGAGGGNFGRGGLGGKEYDHGTAACSPTVHNGGIGGKAVNYNATLNKVFLGGGGGGGHQNDWAPQPRNGIDGKNGGGMVVFRCNTLIGNNRQIDADGMSQDSLSGRDGAGGGGAGGTVLIEANKVIGTVNVHLRGGGGGSLDNNLFNSICHGPGGGGGGGLLWLSDPAIQVNFSTSLNGGAPGKIVNSNSFCFNTTYGATPGLSGGVKANLSIPEGDQFCPWSNLFIQANNDTLEVICGLTNTVDVQANDLAGSAFTTSILTPPLFGTAAVLNGDSIDYDCNGNSKIDSLVYVICLDAFPHICDTATVYFNIKTPEAYDDSGLTPKNTPLTLNLTINDTTGQSYSITVVSNPSNGNVLVLNKDSITYTPFNGFTGTDVFTYKLCFEPGGQPCDTAQVTINVFDIIANDDTDSTMIDQSVTTNVLFNDIYTFSVFVVPICFPENGSILVNPDQSITYTPNPGFLGLDQYCYVICNQGICDTAFVNITVSEVIVPRIFVPNGFSPNGDGVNDLFVIKDIYLSNDNVLRIYNRWGQEIYSKSNYDNSWDGTNDGGEDMPDGTYFYVLKLNDLGEDKQGYVVIQR